MSGLRLYAIALLALRNAFRSKFFLVLLCALVAVMVFFPATIQHDGTLEGLARIYLTYTWGLSGFLLSAALLWAGCSAMAVEIEQKQIHLVVTKPVHRFEIWLGKWIGLTFLAFLLVALSGLASWVQFQRTLQQGDYETRSSRNAWQILAGHDLIIPTPSLDMDKALAHEFKRLSDGGRVKPGSEAMVKSELHKALLQRAFIVPSHTSTTWNLPGNLLGPSAYLRFRYATSKMGTQDVPLEWSIHPVQGAPLVQQTVTNTSDIHHELALPTLNAAPHTPLQMTCANHSELSIVFSPQDGLVLMNPVSSFSANYFRVLLLMLARLALLAAGGLAAGSLFSMPVASLLSVYAVIMLNLGGYLETITQEQVLSPWNVLAEGTPGLSDAVLRWIFKGMHAIVAPLQGTNTLEALALGHLVSWHETLTGVLLYVGCYGLIIGWMTAFLFNRRELGLPQA